MVSEISSRWSKVASTAVAWLDETRVLVGQGQFVMLVDGRSGGLVTRCRVMRAAVVHSLENIPGEDRWLVRGGKSVAVIRVRQNERLEVEVDEAVMSDWIIASAVEGDRLLLLTAHNKLLSCSLQSPSQCQEERELEAGPCILYSGLVLPRERLVMSGTVWGRLLICNLDTGLLLHSVAGHDGVIFSVSFWSGVLVTSSDDRSSILYTCNESFTEVVQVARLWGHTARVFRLGVSEERRTLVSAGEDGRLVSWSLDTGDRLDTVQTSAPVWSLAVRGSSILAGGGDGSVTKLDLGANVSCAVRLEVGLSSPRLVRSLPDRVLVLGEGQLVSYSLTSSQSQLLYSNEDLSSYCLLEVSGDRLVLAGLDGLLVTAGLSGSELTDLQSRRVTGGKIFSCGLFGAGSERTVVTCDGAGRLTVLDSLLQTRAVGELPPMRERWFTASCSWASYYVLGDRSGGLHLYRLSADQLSSVQSWPRLHGRHGVTQVMVDNEILFTSGRDGTVRSFRASEDGGVELIQSVRPGHDWVGGVVRTGGVLSSLLWRGSELQLRSLAGDILLGSADCGGGHRSWALLSPGTDSLSVVYIKDGSVMTSSLSRGHTTVILPGHHTQQVNVVRAVGDLVITGSEDTTVRLFREGRQVGVMRGHLSSVKCLEIVKGPLSSSSLHLLSGGGRGELRLWRLARVGGGVFCRSAASHMVREGGKGRRKAWQEAQSERKCEGETRLMSVAAQQTGEEDLVKVFAACSDGSLRQYSCSLGQERLQLDQTGEARPHCLQQVRLVGGRVVTTSTGGDLTVWATAGLSVVVETRAHQSGVNCLEVRREAEDCWLLVTGGDDTSLAITRYQDNRLDVVWRSDSRAGHTTQVTGLRMVGDLVMSAGVDQRLIVWRLSSERDKELSWHSSKVLGVADISDMDCWQEEEQLHCVVVGVGWEKLDYRNQMILAPMVKVGTLPMRLLALEYGAGIVYTEEIIDKRILASERMENKVLGTIDYIDKRDNSLVFRTCDREKDKLVIQIGTSDPARAAAVGRKVERDVSGLDVNMGCPKSFSLKGGMGAALLGQPDKVRDILTRLVHSLHIPVTAKIRLLPALQDTLRLVDVIQDTGVAALAVHGRTKDQRQGHRNDVETIKKISEHAKIPIIANGGSSNNRNSETNTYEGISEFWRLSGASSVMVARAAEWNPSVFRAGPRDDIMVMIDKYMGYAIQYDYPFNIAKYCVQQLLGSLQTSELGRKFLDSATMEDLCDVFGLADKYRERQRELAAQQRSDEKFVEKMDKTGREERRKRKIDDLEVTEMFCPFVRGHYGDNESCRLPKTLLLMYSRQEGLDQPQYTVEQQDKQFRGRVRLGEDHYGSTSWEKNKKFAEQGAALVAVKCLEITADLIHWRQAATGDTPS